MSAILVIAGGTSPEREVSLRSGSAVVAALTQADHTVTTYDPADGTLEASVDNIDIAFPVLHGIGGEDGQIQEELERVGLPYVGSGVESSRLCFDKVRYKALLATHHIEVPAGGQVRAEDIKTDALFSRPFVLKPYDGGSSVDTFIVRDVGQADWTAIETTLQRYGEMLLEELIDGVEITVAVLNDRGLPVIEIIPPASGEFDYENKYNGATQELCPPVHISEVVQAQARKLAAEIHTLCGCADYSRTDIIVRPDESLVVLETNTLPGMTAQSLFPKAAATAGIPMPQLCDDLVQLALIRRTDRA